MAKNRQNSEPFIFSLIRDHLPAADETPGYQTPMKNRPFYLLVIIIAVIVILCTLGDIFPVPK